MTTDERTVPYCTNLAQSVVDSVIMDSQFDVDFWHNLASSLNTTLIGLFQMIAAESIQQGARFTLSDQAHGSSHFTLSDHNVTCNEELLKFALENWLQSEDGSFNGGGGDGIKMQIIDYSSPTDHKHPYVVLGLVCSILMIAVAVFGLIGNAVSLWYFGRLSAKSSINIMLTAMAVFDCVLLLTGAPLYSLVGIHSYTGYDHLVRSLSCCLVYFYTISTMSQTATAWMLVLITFERYIAVCRPFLARRLCTVGRARKAVLGVSLFAVAYNLVRLWEFESDASPLLRNHPYYRSIYMHWMYLTLVFMIPFSIIAFLNALIIRTIRIARLRYRACRIHSGSTSKSAGNTASRLQSEHRTATMLLMVVLVFMGCEVLAPVLNAMEMVGRTSDPHVFSFLSDLNNLLVLLHSAVNVGIYIGFCSDYRRVCLLIMAAIRHVFCRHYNKPDGASMLELMNGMKWRHRPSVASVNTAPFSNGFRTGICYSYLDLNKKQCCTQEGRRMEVTPLGDDGNVDGMCTKV